jgi:hypothetical protein
VLDRRRISAFAALLALLLSWGAAAAPSAPPPAPPEPAKIHAMVAPEAVAPGGVVAVTVEIVPAAGIKVNRYPKIKLQVAPIENLVGASEAAIGNDSAPKAGQMEANYFKTVDPILLEMKVSEAAKPGRHTIPAKLSYFYCVAASGFCAPAKASVEIPVTVR